MRSKDRRHGLINGSPNSGEDDVGQITALQFWRKQEIKIPGVLEKIRPISDDEGTSLLHDLGGFLGRM